MWQTASKCPEAALAYYVATITNSTTASGLELRGLRMSCILLRDEPEISEIYIPADAVKKRLTAPVNPPQPRGKVGSPAGMQARHSKRVLQG